MDGSEMAGENYRIDSFHKNINQQNIDYFIEITYVALSSIFYLTNI